MGWAGPSRSDLRQLPVLLRHAAGALVEVLEDGDRVRHGVLRVLRVRSEVNIELNFTPKLRGARSRLYRRRFLQVNTRWKALAEIYTMHSFAPFFNLKISAKNRQHFFAIE